MVGGIARRLHEVKNLYDLLPKGSESGKEFARVVDLLLFHEARRKSRNLVLFDDRAGDFESLDALERTGKDVIGYQHKFFPSPLSAGHRQEIESSLSKALEARRKQKRSKIRSSRRESLKKWILVTPTDFVNPSERKDGGDVAWFEGLRKKINVPFEIEHWGHKQLLGLFLDAPAIGLYYYPELFPDGVNRRKTIRELRTRYDDAFSAQHRQIEFIGMSVYKAEASRGVPMENIYIPLSVVPNESDENDDNVERRDPVDFLTHGAHHVILGDPGSGKTTLLKFLALYGQSEELQQRYTRNSDPPPSKFKLDERLPILVTLRRYTDELRKNANLSLIEYMRQNIEGDYSISGLSIEFIEFYLESGRAVLLFDGMDELPDSGFKKTIRDRIYNLSKTYPRNTIIVTSRIYGYEEIRFDEKEFFHHRLTKLRMSEIEQFIRDWYAVRVESERDRKEHMDSLLAILFNEEHESIRELARNPLLLTIIVLVHRIDAVLPDERVVLYQKCTETLLNSWHIWKFHDRDALHRAKVDRQNRHRMQAIAHWMHRQGGGGHAGRQAVVTYKNLQGFLTKHIAAEVPPDPDYPPQDIAAAFLEFVQDRAGLLIEVGDRQFSFVHLTFQEYLTAAHIKTVSELEGVRSAWDYEIRNHCSDPRWREVIRLLVASYDADASQEFLLDKLFEHGGDKFANVLLLGGLYLDGVSAAQQRKSEIFRRLFQVAAKTDQRDLLRLVLSILRKCSEKSEVNVQHLQEVARSLCVPKSDTVLLERLRLISLSLGWNLSDIEAICGLGLGRDQALLSMFFDSSHDVDQITQVLREEIELLCDVTQSYSLTDPLRNFVAASLESLTMVFGADLQRPAFDRAITVLSHLPEMQGPFSDFFYNLVLTSRLLGSRISYQDLAHVTSRYRVDIVEPIGTEEEKSRETQDRTLPRARALIEALKLAAGENGKTNFRQFVDRAATRALNRAASHHVDLRIERNVHSDDLFFLARARAVGHIIKSQSPSQGLEQLLSNPDVSGPICETLCHVFTLEPAALWHEVLSSRFIPTLSNRLELCVPRRWQQITESFKADNGRVEERDVEDATWLLILDVWMFLFECYEEPGQSMFAELASCTRNLAAPSLRIAHCIRDLAFGDGSRADDLVAMVRADDVSYSQIFTRCCWHPTPEEAVREAKEAKKERN